jgi:signal transduction histidine kinase
VKLLEESLPRAYNMSKGTLTMYQPSGFSKIRIAAAILDICTPMRRYVRDEFPETVVEIFTDLSEIEKVEIAVNPIPIERAIINLVDNAAHYCSKAPISKIWITGKRNFRADPQRPIEISISDTGRGLNVISRARLFRPRSTERPDESTGIGLFLTKTLLSEIDATIECQERPLWAGASFIIRLPERVV